MSSLGHKEGTHTRSEGSLKSPEFPCLMADHTVTLLSLKSCPFVPPDMSANVHIELEGWASLVIYALRETGPASPLMLPGLP